MTASLGRKRQGPRQPVFVHVGEAKTGTTYLQNVLDTNRDALAENGFLYPPCGGSGHVFEVLDLRRVGFKDNPDPRFPGSWDRVVARIRAWDGPALISQELLSPARQERIDRLMNSFDFADVHIICTVRDMARQLPAAWQEWVKNRGQESFAEWLAAVHDPESIPGEAGRDFWKMHDVEGILAKWSRRLPPERVHVVTVPPSGGDRNLLWQRFAQVIGVIPDQYRYQGLGTNSSLGAAEVSVIRQVNMALGGDEFPWPDYDRFMKWYLSPELSRRRGVPIELPEHEYEWAIAQSQRTAKAIAEAGYDVVGDLDELMPTSRPVGMDPDNVPGDLQAEVGVAGITALIHRLVQGTEIRESPELLARAAEAEGKVREHQDLPPVERIKRCLVELSEQVHWLGVARRGYAKLRRRRPQPTDAR
jgi:hypothetical protein